MTKDTTKTPDPFWVSPNEKKAVSSIEYTDFANQVADAVPNINTVEKGSLVGEYGIKDQTLFFHFYKKDRKVIFDSAQSMMDDLATMLHGKELQAQQAKVARQANAELDKVPWWPNTESVLDDVFSECFRYLPHKINYYPEVDSWSVITPIPYGPGSLSLARLELPYSMAALRFGG